MPLDFIGSVKIVAEALLPWLLERYQLWSLIVLNCRNAKSFSQLSNLKRIGLVLACLIWNTPSSAQTFINPSNIITASDYPANSWKRGDQGITSFRLKLGANGQATGCTIVESSGFEELDNATCRLMVERAKFDMSTVLAANTEATYSNRVRWQIPIRAPRVLLFGVTSVKLPVQSDAAKAKCQYSDGVVRIIDAAQNCDRQIPTLTVNEKGKKIKTNIFQKYINEVEYDKNAESAYNLSVLFGENDFYEKSVFYLEKSSSLGNPIASSALCQMYGFKEYEMYVEFNPNQAIEFCVLSFKQQYNTASITIFEELKNKYDQSLDDKILQNANSIILRRNHESDAQSIVEGSKIVRSIDYPQKENMRQIGGITVTFLEIDKSGRVKKCIIVQSTYSYLLDQRACTRLKAAALYTPAIIDGAPSISWTSRRVLWNPAAPYKPDAGNIFMQIFLGLLGAAI